MLKHFSLSRCIRDFTVQKALLLRGHVPKEPTVPVQLSVMHLSVHLVVEDSTAVGWDFQLPLDPAQNASTADREPNLQYENLVFFKLNLSS